MGKSKIPETGIYDARQLGTGRMLLLGFQHMFAMFGATILVPILTGLDVSNTLLFAGLGTLLFHLITGGKVPAFLGSSFAFLGGYATIAPMLDGNQPNLAMLPYACFGVACAGLVYVILAGLFKAFGAKKVMRFFPPIVTGPIIILIGLNGNFVLKLNPIGDILATLAAVVWACYSILMKKIGAFRINMVLCTRRVFFYGLLFMVPALFLFDCRLGLERFASPTNTLNLLYLGFGASALCFVTWNWAVRILGAVKTTVYIYLVPVITVVSSVIILHETITPLAVVGTALTLTGLIVSQK